MLIDARSTSIEGAGQLYLNLGQMLSHHLSRRKACHFTHLHLTKNPAKLSLRERAPEGHSHRAVMPRGANSR